MAGSSVREDTLVVVLAAGKGTRMGNEDLVKVCFEIDGVPAINRQIDVFKSCRISRFLLVVGDRAEQVLRTVVPRHPEVMYVYQEPQLGTGHAARVAADSLQAIGYSGNVLVSTGDKLIEKEAIESLLDGFVKQQADMALLTVPKTKATAGSVGRVFVDRQGQALDIIEVADRRRQAAADELRAKLDKGAVPTAGSLQNTLDKQFPNPKKQQRAVPELIELAAAGDPVDPKALRNVLDSKRYQLTVDGEPYSAHQIERRCSDTNPSLYLYRSDLFYKAVGMLDNNNAQKEYYITDTVRLLGCQRDREGKRSYRVRAISLDNPDCIQGFNSPDELLVIQDYVRRKKSLPEQEAKVSLQPRLAPSQYATVAEWLDRVDPDRRDVKRWLREIYGAHDDLHTEKCKDFAKVLNCYGKAFGFDEKVCIVRAPGRINLMGRHVDHRGGWTNFLAIAQETIAVAGLRDDDTVQAVSAEPRRFSPVSFRMSELMGRFAWSDWVNFVNSDWVRDLIYREAGHWGNYLKAAMLRLQHGYHDVMVRGINMAVIGNVPMAAGLSSSSTLVVATLQAAIALNNFELTSRQFIDMCGEGEWFVGSRGGAGDHAAIYLGQRGKIAHVGYHPFQLQDVFEAPKDYQVVVANSHIQAAKSSGARDQFNSRISAYNLGLAVLKQRAPEYASAMEHLRDVTPATLGCSTSDIYRLLLKVPQTMTRQDFRDVLSGDHQPLIDSSFATHADPKTYHPRGVLLFGIAEILRAKKCVELLKEGHVEAFGRLMRISHDGDRVSARDALGTVHRLADPCTDDYLRRLIDDLRSEDPRRVERAQLDQQAGYYACSTEEIDGMVDSLANLRGVAGAQIAGAGLGGCIMALVRKEVVPEVRRTLDRGYYRPAELKPAVIPCIGVEGAGLVEFA